MKDMDELLAGVYSATIAEIAVLVREVRVRIGILPTPVTVRIYYDAREAEPYSFELSAVMRTAPAREAHAREPLARTEGDALRQAVRMLTQDYEDAVRQGQMPDDGWLVPVPGTFR
ncbi:MAG TPA: hypothetical protein VEK11_20175 [Thermoanaerobaculia bacterium]|nr:hypothetical protein [Thermoanaerobaculia bacterium]